MEYSIAGYTLPSVDYLGDDLAEDCAGCERFIEDQLEELKSALDSSPKTSSLNINLKILGWHGWGSDIIICPGCEGRLVDGGNSYLIEDFTPIWDWCYTIKHCSLCGKVVSLKGKLKVK